jgi:hypothetical protein
VGNLTLSWVPLAVGRYLSTYFNNYLNKITIFQKLHVFVTCFVPLHRKTTLLKLLAGQIFQGRLEGKRVINGNVIPSRIYDEVSSRI